MTLKSRWIGLVTIVVLFAMAQIQIFPDVSPQTATDNQKLLVTVLNPSQTMGRAGPCPLINQRFPVMAYPGTTHDG